MAISFAATRLSLRFLPTKSVGAATLQKGGSARLHVHRPSQDLSSAASRLPREAQGTARAWFGVAVSYVLALKLSTSSWPLFCQEAAAISLALG